MTRSRARTSASSSSPRTSPTSSSRSPARPATASSMRPARPASSVSASTSTRRCPIRTPRSARSRAPRRSSRSLSPKTSRRSPPGQAPGRRRPLGCFPRRRRRTHRSMTWRALSRPTGAQAGRRVRRDAGRHAEDLPEQGRRRPRRLRPVEVVAFGEAKRTVVITSSGSALQAGPLVYLQSPSQIRRGKDDHRAGGGPGACARDARHHEALSRRARQRPHRPRRPTRRGARTARRERRREDDADERALRARAP